MPGPLLTFAQREVDRLVAARAALLPIASDAGKALSKAQAAYAAAVGNYTSGEQAIAAIRRALSAPGLLDADVQKLASDLRAALIALRADRRVVLDAEDALRAAERAQARDSATLAGLDAALAAAGRVVAEAKDREKAQQAWKDALGKPPLDTLGTAIDNAIAGQTLKDAKTRVEADIPAKLLARAHDRWKQQVDRLDQARAAAAAAEDQVDARRGADFGKAGASDARATALRRAEEDLAAYVATAGARLDRAVAAITAVVAEPTLTTAEAAAIHDAALEADREAAAALEATRDSALAARDAKRTELDRKRLEILSADPDANPDADPAYTTLKGDLATLQGTLDAAEAASTQAARDTLETWEAAVPDHIWDNIARYIQAGAALDTLKATDPHALATAMDQAASLLASALAALAKADRAVALLRDEADALGQSWKAAGEVQGRKALSALRGDGVS